MRKLLLLLPFCAAMTCLGSPARAYDEGPWCAVFSNGGGGASEDCHYRDFETCRQNIVAGMRGFCNQNPRWPGYYQSPSTQHGKPRRRPPR